ncbi:MAG: hypothetical protein SNF33_01675 [Candidatus Algichlamydia australiensis]|nr:hypothetical protein [Chlamydiales bacterium]
MSKPKTSKRRAQSISTALFLLGLAYLFFTGIWWPNILLVVGIPLAIRQFLNGRFHDMVVTLAVFLGVFVTTNFKIAWNLLLPILFTVGAIYILIQEFFESRSETEEELEEDLNVEIEIDEYRDET